MALGAKIKMNIGLKIRKLRKAKGLTLQELADSIGCSNQIISFWENDKTEPSPTLRKKLCAALGITEADLFSDLPPGAIEVKEFIKVPLLGTAPAGDKEWVEDEVETWYDLPKKLFKGGKKIYLVRARGDSMIEANIKAGDIVIVYFEAEAHNGNRVIAWIDDEVTIKKFYRYDKTIVLRPANPRYPEKTYTAKNKVHLRGVVKGVLFG